MTQKLYSAQTDFSYGQVNADFKRRDDTDPVRSGGRIMSNWRILATGQLVPRPGRWALFAPGGPRTERVRMGDGSVWEVAFSSGKISIFTTGGDVAASNVSAAYLWTNDTAKRIVYAVAQNEVVICFPGMRPQVLRWTPDPASWTFEPFSFNSSANQVYEPFFRLSVLGATMQPSAVSGAITLTCSVDYFSPSMIGRVISYVGQQITITGVTDARNATAQVSYRLPQTISIPVDQCAVFQPGQIASAAGENIKIEVASTSAATGPGNVIGTLLSTISFMTAWDGMDGAIRDTMTTPLGTSRFTGAPTLYGGTPAKSLQWQEEFMSDLNGWPASCFYDRGRLGFCDFPQMTGAIVWSALSGSRDFWVDTVAAVLQPEAGVSPDAAIFDIIPGSPVVKFVTPFHGDQFAFTDRGIYYIPIQATSNPLKPGSVEFRQIANDGCAGIPPISTQDAIVFVNAGGTRCSAVRATGSYTLPYDSADISDPHGDLFNDPVCMAITTGDGQHQERYVYVLNAGGTLAVGKFSPERKFVGWLPWSSAYPTTWVTTDGADVLYTTRYPGAWVAEQEDDALFMDGVVALNDPPAALAIPGRGTMWFAPSVSAVLMESDDIDLGDRAIDANGNVQFADDDDTSPASLIAGIAYPAPRFQPFPRNAPHDGPAVAQRQRRRKLSRAVANVINSSGFTFGARQIAATNFGEDARAKPVLRETTYQVRLLGRGFDPIIPEIVKDRPGPFTLCEYGQEETV